MKRLSTRRTNDFDRKMKQNPERTGSYPRRRTIDFLKQFARVYQAEPVLNPDFCAYILN